MEGNRAESTGRVFVEGISIDSLVNAIATRVSEIVEQRPPKLVGGEHRYMGRHEAARFLEVSLPTLDRMVRKNEVPSTKLGKKRRFKLSDLEACLQAKVSSSSERAG